MAFENIDSKKFEGLFMSMERQLVMQTSFMESMYNLAIEEREDRKERENILDTMRKEEPGRGSAFENFEDVPTPRVNESAVSSAFSSFLGLIPGILGSISLAGIGATLLKGGFALAIAPAVGNFVEGLINQALTDFDLPEGFTSTVSGLIGDAAQWTLLGGMIGGKIGKIFGATGFVYEQLNKWLDPDQDGTIKEGFLKGWNPDNLSLIGAATATALGLALPKLISKSLPGILGGMALPAIVPQTGAAQPKAGPGPRVTPSIAGGAGGPAPRVTPSITGGGISLKTIAKGGAAFGVISAAAELAETGDLGMAAASGTGATVGGIVGGAVGSLGGPIGTAIGAAIGSAIGDYLGREALEYARTPVSEAGPPPVGYYTDRPAGAPNRAQAYMENKPTPAVPMTPEQIAESEAAIAAAEPFAIAMDTYEAPVAKKEETKPLPYYLSDSNSLINNAIKAYTNKIAPDGDISFAIDMERMKRLDRINQEATESGRTGGGNIAIGGTTTVGGSTTNNNNKNTVINNYVRPEVALDHYLP